MNISMKTNGQKVNEKGIEIELTFKRLLEKEKELRERKAEIERRQETLNIAQSLSKQVLQEIDKIKTDPATNISQIEQEISNIESKIELVETKNKDVRPSTSKTNIESEISELKRMQADVEKAKDRIQTLIDRSQ